MDLLSHGLQTQRRTDSGGGRRTDPGRERRTEPDDVATFIPRRRPSVVAEGDGEAQGDARRHVCLRGKDV